MADYGKNWKPAAKDDIICIFDVEAKPKEGYKETDYFIQRKYHFEKYPSYKYSQLDSEEKKDQMIGATSHVLAQIVAICGRVYSKVDKKPMEFRLVDINDEKPVLQEFADKIVNSFASIPTLWVHFNGLNYDCPLILRKCVKHGIEIKNWNFSNLAKYRLAPHYDMYAITSNWGSEPADLATICQDFGIDSPKKDATIYDHIATATEEEITSQCMKDIDAEDALFQKLRKVYRY